MGGDALEEKPNFFRRQVLYPGRYAAFILASALDLLLTWKILYHGGTEMNRIAAWLIDHTGRGGIVAFKFAIVGMVVITCELVGRRREHLGKFLATWAIVLPGLVVIWELYLLFQTR